MWNKKWPKFCRSGQKVTAAAFTLKINAFKIGQKVAKYLGLFCTYVWAQELSKSTQSGHTDTKGIRFIQFLPKCYKRLFTSSAQKEVLKVKLNQN